MSEVRSPLQGVVVRVATAAGDDVGEASPVVVIESMKMEHVVPAGGPGRAGMWPSPPATRSSGATSWW